MFIFGACGGGGGTPDATVSDAPRPDSTSNCQPIGAQGQFTRRAGNPRLLAGSTTFADGQQDLSFREPDVSWDGSKYQLYYAATHAPAAQVIRHASSSDRMTWTVDDAPALAASTEAGAWDSMQLSAPTVVYNPAAPSDRRYLMLYAGADATFPGQAYPHEAIGAAISADGITFTRVSAAESPHGKAGLVFTGKDAYPARTHALVGDPELVLVGGVYHLWFSSTACVGASCGISEIGIGHATSTDGIHWTTLEAPVRSLLRASADLKSGGFHPSVVYDAPRCRYELWLTSDLATETAAQPVDLDNMVGVFKGESSDGITWSVNYTRARDLAWSANEAGEHLGLRAGADVAQNTTGRLMVYVGFDDQNVPASFTLPSRTPTGSRPGVMTLQIATRDLP